MCAANGDVSERREHLMLRTIAGEICDFLRGLVPMGFSQYALLPENGLNFGFFLNYLTFNIHR